MYTQQEIQHLRDIKEGVYLIRHKDSQKYPNLVYVGQSSNIYKRWREHLTCGKKSGAKKLSEAFCQHGSDNFFFDILEECKLVGTTFEQKWILLYNSMENGLNVTLNVNNIPKDLKSLGGKKTSTRAKNGEINIFWNSSSAKQAQEKSMGSRALWKYTNSKGNSFYSLGVPVLARTFGFNPKSFSNWASSGGTIPYKQFKDMKIVRLKDQSFKTALEKEKIYTESQIQNLKLGELLES